MINPVRQFGNCAFDRTPCFFLTICHDCRSRLSAWKVENNWLSLCGKDIGEFKESPCTRRTFNDDALMLTFDPLPNEAHLE